MVRRLQPKPEALAVRKALGRSPLDRPAYTEPAPAPDGAIEQYKTEQAIDRIAHLAAAQAQINAALRILSEARTSMELAVGLEHHAYGSIESAARDVAKASAISAQTLRALRAALSVRPA